VNATDFVWLQGAGNIGPRRRVSHCGTTRASCSTTNWETSVRTHTSSDCGSGGEYLGTILSMGLAEQPRRSYAWCRFRYDFCDGYYCKSSATATLPTTCTGNEQSCYNETSCCGSYNEDIDYTWTECSAQTGLCS